MKQTTTEARELRVIAREILDDWGQKVNYAAVPYLRAMGSLGSIDESYCADPARTVVMYFLSNASSWRGETARRVKAELRRMIR